jgi:hypothetical protein
MVVVVVVVLLPPDATREDDGQLRLDDNPEEAGRAGSLSLATGSSQARQRPTERAALQQ